MRRVLIVITGFLFPFLVGATIVFNPPVHELHGTVSRSIQNEIQYPYRVESFEVTDASRVTPPMGDFEGASYRELVGKIWIPDADEKTMKGPFPLVIYSHGFMSFHEESDYLGEFLAHRGYIMVAFDFPASSLNAPGGPNLADLPNQPGDISFLIDEFIKRNEDPGSSLYQQINIDKIATAGLSLGGLTTTLVAYHKELRDDRIGAAISIAGPTSFFNKSFFETTDVPFMYIAGNIDAMIHYESNAKTFKDKMSDATVVTIDNGSHTGFADISEKIFRWNDNPDDVGCSFLLNHIPQSEDNPFAVLGGEEVGINFKNFDQLPCQNMPLPVSIAPGKQLLLTKLAVFSFLQAQFSSPRNALTSNEFLNLTFAAENDAISVE